MIENFPLSINVVFVLATLYTIFFFYISNSAPKRITLLLILWTIVQSLLAYSGFYQNFDAIPPRFLFVLVVPTLAIILSLRSKNLIGIIRNRQLKYSTFLHVVRIPVEICLYYLFLHKMIPELMTFEGRNYDILAGITACVVGVSLWFGHLSRRILIGWNILGLLLVLFILGNGLLSAPLPIQQFGFDQPNLAVNYFPYILLPAVIVPVVVFTHITDIIKLLRS